MTNENSKKFKLKIAPGVIGVLTIGIIVNAVSLDEKWFKERHYHLPESRVSSDTSGFVNITVSGITSTTIVNYS